MRPLETGLETFSVLKSPRAPEEIRLLVSDGVTARELGDGRIGLFRGDVMVATVSRAFALDADKRQVPVGTTVTPTAIDHRASNATYPILAIRAD